MRTKIFHQLGFRHNWNFESYGNDNIGDGFILAPRYIDKNFIEKLDLTLRKKSIFDPQFFVPDTSKGKLSTYDFFPNEIAIDDYSTNSFQVNYSYESSKRCLDFQIENDFKTLIIPTNYVEGTPPDYIEKQSQSFVNPFLTYLDSIENSKEIYLQIIVNELMLTNVDFFNDLLNWITSFDNIDGVYLIYSIKKTSKQIKDTNLLLKLLRMIDVFKSNGLSVMVGYQNVEAILVAIASPDIVSIGSYENLRAFNVKSFIESENNTQLGPKPRLFMSKLLQWVEHPYLGAINARYGTELYDSNHYHAEMFEPTFQWHFGKPQLYKHYFLTIYNKLQSIFQLENKSRYEYIKSLLLGAINSYRLLEQEGIVFDSNSDGSHLHSWLTVANIYAKEKGWN